jgi:signal recognition particle subunit SRP54
MLTQTSKLGPMQKVMGMIPGLGKLTETLESGDVDVEQDMRHLVGIIDSMTSDERRSPKQIDTSRRRRIAAGAGVEPHEVNELVKQFDTMSDYMKMFSSMGIRDRLRAVQQMGASGALNPGAKLAKLKKGTGKRLTAEEKARARKLREREMRRKKRDDRKKG